MDSHAVDRLAEEHHWELVTLAQNDQRARRAGRVAGAAAVATGEAAVATGEAVGQWRLYLAQRLVSAGLRLGLPPRRRHAASSYAQSLLVADDPASGGPSSAS